MSSGASLAPRGQATNLYVAARVPLDTLDILSSATNETANHRVWHFHGLFLLVTAPTAKSAWSA